MKKTELNPVTPMPIDDSFWSELLKAIKNNECVLFLGPRAVMYEGSCVHDLLVDHFKTQLHNLGKSVDESELSLASLIKQFKDSVGQSDEFLKLGNIFTNFYKQFKVSQIPLYQNIAKSPFKYIINTTPDDMIREGLESFGQNCLFYDFHFRDPGRNAENNENAREIDKKLKEGYSLVYNLLGIYEQPDSLVLTEYDRLVFLEKIIQGEFSSSSANLDFHFYGPPKKNWRKAYVFLGFDFNDWHLKMFLHLLRRGHSNLPQTINFQKEDGLSKDNRAFFREIFRVHFEEDSDKFFRELKQKMQEENEPLPSMTQEPIEIMVLHDPNDVKLFNSIKPHLLSLNRATRKVEIWHEPLPDENIQETMLEKAKTAHLFIPLFTANLLANIDKFQEIFDLRLQLYQDNNPRYKFTALVMRPCLIDSYEPLAEVNTVYPRPRGTAISEKRDPELAILEFVKELDRIITSMLNNGI